MSRPLRHRRPLFAALVVLVLAGVYEGANTIRPATAASSAAQAGGTSRPGRAAVATAVRACAAPGSASPTSGSVALAAVPGTAPAGKVVLSALTPGGSASPGATVSTATQAGTLHVFRVRTAPPLTAAERAGKRGSSPSVTTAAARGGVQVSATGAMAQGLDVEQTGSSGLATAQCGAPGTNFWFLGPGEHSAATIELYLMNSGSIPADAQVSVLTDVTKGPPLVGNVDNGIMVPPHSMVVQSLGKLLQLSQVMALNVTTSVGEVVPAVRESRTAVDPGGWLPLTQPPARKLVIPGLPGSSGPRQLYLAVPGSASAQVKVTAVSAKGSYQPTGGSGIDLLEGSATSLALPSLGGVAGAIVISASVPVVASMLVPGGPAGTPGALAVSSEPIAEQGVVAANPAPPAGSTGLVLSAPGKAATVRITSATSSTSAAGQQGKVVQIRARSSVVVRARPPAGSKTDQFMLVVTPLSGSGPVYAGRIISSGGTVQSILPVTSSLTWIPLPAVGNSLSAFLP